MAMLAGFFGFLAAVLATVGLYGVMSYMVARRQNEIGIRIALGASRTGVMRLVLRDAGTLLAIGLAVGTALALAAGAAARAMLFGLRPYDPLTLALAGGVVAPGAPAAGLFSGPAAAGRGSLVGAPGG